MAAAGIVALIEPGSAGAAAHPPRSGSLYRLHVEPVGWERFRRAQFGIHHYCTIGLNSRKRTTQAAETKLGNPAALPSQGGVVAVGEIGYDDQTPVEDKYYRAQLALAKEFDMAGQVHTPHRDKKSGTIAAWKLLSKWA